MVKTKRRRYSKRKSYKKRSYQKRSNKKNGGSFFMTNLPTVLLGLGTVGAMTITGLYYNYTSKDDKPSPPPTPKSPPTPKLPPTHKSSPTPPPPTPKLPPFSTSPESVEGEIEGTPKVAEGTNIKLLSSEETKGIEIVDNVSIS